MLTQLNPPIPLDTPKGKALAHFVIDYGPEHNLMWVTFVDDTGECWTWPNPKVRAQKNITLGRTRDMPVNPLPPEDKILSRTASPTNGKTNGHTPH